MTVASAAGVRKVRTRRAIPPKRVDPRQERRLTANNAITIVRRAPRKGPQTRWGRSSAGRASRSQCEGQGFDPPRLHQFTQKLPSPPWPHPPLVGWRSPACSAQGDGETALHARAGHHCLVPALDIGEVRQIDLVAFVPPGPAEDREIGNRDLTA